MTTKTIFSAKLVNTKVIYNFLRFLESTRTQEDEFVCGRYDQNTELDRDNSEQDEMTMQKDLISRCNTQTKSRT
jgi:hypothetical protein